MHMATTSVPTGANVAPPVWPPETDLVLTPGTSKLMLTLQQPLVQAVIQDSFEFVRAALLLQCALPNTGLSASFVRDALSSGAMLNMPGAASVLRRLQTDTLYRAKIVPLVSFSTLNLTKLTLFTAACSYLPLLRSCQRRSAVHLLRWSFQVWILKALRIPSTSSCLTTITSTLYSQP